MLLIISAFFQMKIKGNKENFRSFREDCGGSKTS